MVAVLICSQARGGRVARCMANPAPTSGQHDDLVTCPLERASEHLAEKSGAAGKNHLHALAHFSRHDRMTMAL